MPSRPCRSIWRMSSRTCHGNPRQLLRIASTTPWVSQKPDKHGRDTTGGMSRICSIAPVSVAVSSGPPPEDTEQMMIKSLIRRFLAARPPKDNLQAIKLKIKQDWTESAYYDLAERQEHLDVFWGHASPFKMMFDRLDLERVVELACGHGRHSAELLRLSPQSSLVLVDVNKSNIVHCRNRFADCKNVRCYVNDGSDIACCTAEFATALFSYDAMVHFEYDDVAAYLREIYRVLRPGGRALLHHSNNTGEPGKPYSQCVHWRNFMSAPLFNHMAARAGMAVIDQKVLDWGSAVQIDAITLLERPG